MKVLIYLARVIFGLTFVISGFFKFVDPVGTSLIIKEYLSALNIDLPISLYLGILLSVFEFIVGAAVFLRLRTRIFVGVGLAMMIYFTLLTLWLAIANPIEDCGCFGEAIKLSNWQTFYKNIVLLILVVFLFFKRDKLVNKECRKTEYIYLLFFVVLSLFIVTGSLRYGPLLEFGQFSVGTDIQLELEKAQSNADFKSSFIYEKNGKKEEFALENLPDSTWTFLESKSELISSSELSSFDFSVSDDSGNYVSQELLAQPKLFFSVIHDLDSFNSEEYSSKLYELADSLDKRNINLYILATSLSGNVEKKLGRLPSNVYIYNSDYKTLISLSRTNGGFVFVADAIVAAKWPIFYSNSRIIGAVDKGADNSIVRRVITSRLVWEILLVLFILSRYILLGLRKFIHRRQDDEK